MSEAPHTRPPRPLSGKGRADVLTQATPLPQAPLSRRQVLVGSVGVLAAAGLGWGGGGHGPRAESIRFLTIGTGTAGGTYFPIGGILANAISNPPGSPGCDRGGSCGVPGVIAVAQTTSGAVENVEALRTARYETGLVQADIGFLAYKAKGPYAGKPPFTELRALANLYSETVHLVVRGDSPIKTVNDLKGRRVALGEKGSGTLPTALLILQAHDLSEKTVQPFYLNPGTAGDRLASGQLDAFFIIGGYPLPAVADVAARLPVRLISIIDSRLPRLSPGLPLFTETMIGGDGAYVGVPETKTLGVGAQWLATTALPDELAYGIVKALWHPNTHRLLVAGHPRGDSIRKEAALTGLAVPLHPGAARYYREQGFDVTLATSG
ncbi:TAXI family TRAP transporter solute-binding subunit [Nitrospirillum iridis]|uniref:TAXI family TRAP transporter solute-binding subunit n=1 Tax=Nitrospirillum iridis TaxID=765888 RepID=A0A7X0AYH0_9PROT|nr:hypothetical protein [Nitrospirillum iridis]